jgi:membrane protein implicated in regulation of membrane protease activity
VDEDRRKKEMKIKYTISKQKIVWTANSIVISIVALCNALVGVATFWQTPNEAAIACTLVLVSVVYWYQFIDKTRKK